MTRQTIACQVPLSMGFSRGENWSGSHSLLQGIFLIQGSNGVFSIAGSLYLLSHQGSPNGLGPWVLGWCDFHCFRFLVLVSVAIFSLTSVIFTCVFYGFCLDSVYMFRFRVIITLRSLPLDYPRVCSHCWLI